MDAELAHRLDRLQQQVVALSDELAATALQLRDLAEPAGAAEAAPPELLGAREVGRRLGLSESAVYERIAGGALPCVRLGRAVRVPADAVEALQRSATMTRPGLRHLPAAPGARRPTTMRGA